MEKPVEEVLPMEELPFWQQPVLLNYGKQLLGILFVLLLVFGVLRPVMRSLTDNSKQLREMEAQRALSEMSATPEGGVSDETVTLSGGDNRLLAGPNQNFGQQVDAVKGLVEEDPERVAQVVQKWVDS